MRRQLLHRLFYLFQRPCPLKFLQTRMHLANYEKLLKQCPVDEGKGWLCIGERVTPHSYLLAPFVRYL